MTFWAMPCTPGPLECSRTVRFAFCNEGFGDTPWEWVCSAIAAAGYQGIEIAPFTFSDDIRTFGIRERAEIKRSADRAGIEVVGLH